MSFTVFSYNATVLFIQPKPTHHRYWKMRPNPTQPMDVPNPCLSHLSVRASAVRQSRCFRSLHLRKVARTRLPRVGSGADPGFWQSA